MLPPLYHSPKWLAPVKPDSKRFWLPNGTTIGNLWEFKQTLKNLPDDMFKSLVGDHTNFFADWIDSTVWDHDLARILHNQTTRWGMIVALERHLMRTLNLPHYVAARWLAATTQPFYLANGQYINSLEELKHALMYIDDYTFDQHLQRLPNDFVNWINNAIGDYELTEILASINDRTKFFMYLSDHLEMLHDAAQEY